MREKKALKKEKKKEEKQEKLKGVDMMEKDI
jgi:hypothetical protein